MLEAEIRPEALLNEYLRLSREDALLMNKAGDTVSCPGCQSKAYKNAFLKHGFQYVTCSDCQSLYLNPRPNQSQLSDFYRDSASSKFWSTQFFPQVAEARREKMFRPRVHTLQEWIGHLLPERPVVIDAGAGYGIFLEEWRKVFPLSECIALEPGPSLAERCRSRGFKTVEAFVETAGELKGTADLVVCFEVLEHVYDAHEFVRALTGFLKPGGILVVTTLGIDGFDLQVLWDESASIFPPHHINFLSRRGFLELFARSGLEKSQISTPGKLDVEIVRKGLGAKKDLSRIESFLYNLLSGAEASKILQPLLAKECLSSHTWVTGQKPLESK